MHWTHVFPSGVHCIVVLLQYSELQFVFHARLKEQAQSRGRP